MLRHQRVLVDGFSTITNYDPTLTYTFNPVGPTIDASGLIQSMVLGIVIQLHRLISSLCTSIVSSAFVKSTDVDNSCSAYC